MSEAVTLGIRRARAAGESGAALVTDEHIDAFTLAGTPDQVRDRLRGWVDAGLDIPIALPIGEDPLAQMELIGAELGPWLEALA